MTINRPMLEPCKQKAVFGAVSVQLLSVSVEQLFEKGFLALGMAVLMAVTVWLSVAGIVAPIILRLQKRGLLRRNGGGRILGASLDDLVEFPSIEPNTPALWAIVNLDALSFTHHERDPTDGTRHTGSTGHRQVS
jgi:hypothetical protein